MKKLVISLAVIFAYTAVCFNSLYMTHAKSNMDNEMISGTEIVSYNNPPNASNCMGPNGSCKHEIKCHININTDYVSSQNVRIIDKKESKTNKDFFLYSLNKDYQINYLIRGPDTAYSVKHNSNYFSFVRFKESIVLRV